MREIKFRGKPIEGKLPNGEVLTGNFVYGNLVIIRIEYHILSPYGKVFKNYNVKPETVGQFTGLYDANGKEIYEGDILRTSISKEDIGFIRWNINDASFVVQMRNSAQCYNVWRGYEVIGNIHDNPELLKGDKK